MQQELQLLEEHSNLRRLPRMAHDGRDVIVNGKRMLNLSSNDYLGLASDRALREEFLRTLTPDTFLPTSSSSRLLTGNFTVYEELETELAHLFGTEAALVFNSGYHANTGILPAVSDAQTLILADTLVHASLIDGIRLSAAKCIRYRHNDLAQLERLLKEHHSAFRQIIIVTESIFSMDGDQADLPALAELKRRYGNVLLYVDEAHAFGVRGRQGLGCAEESGCTGDIDFHVGTFGKAAYDFADFLHAAGQRCWQMLPLGPTSYGDSPYQSFSAFAGNPYFIDYRLLADVGLLTADEVPAARPVGPIDYGALYNERPVILKKAADRLLAAPSPSYEAFCEAQSFWLEDYALFMAVKAEQGQAGLADWPDDLRCRKPEAIAAAKQRLAGAVDYYKAVQFFFYTQWNALKAYANGKGVRLVGDIPIYVSPDSSDLWTHPELFQTDGAVHLTSVAGCPPDAFAADGQLWGNPLYRWEAHRATGYQWWITRLWYCIELYDVVRIDHFRGFDEYFSIPYGSETAVEGHWEKGPGIELFRAVEQALGKREIIAEDLGYMSETVRQLVRDSGFPGMKVLEFAFDSRDTGSASDYLPHNYPVNSVAYTGTHDNETLVSWYQTVTDAERAMVRDYLYDYATPEEQLYKSMIALILRSAAATCIVPMQDWLGLDNSARINKPSTVGQNWRWRLKKTQLTKKLQKEICQLTARYGRMNWA